MKVWEILRSKGSRVVTVSPRQAVVEAIALMNENGIGALVVLSEKEEILGIISERDVLRRVLKTPTPDLQRPVEDFMTKDIIVGVPEDRAGYVMGVMTKNRLRHLPIMDKGKLVGIISIGDVVKVKLEETEFENRHLREYITGP